MSTQNSNLSCVRCKSYLFEEDDVVYCPVCGAPHHRECYNALGHCALEELHGTDKEYTKPSPEQKREEPDQKAKDNFKIVNKCEMCGEEYDPSLNRCPKCGTPDMRKAGNMGGFVQFDFLGGIPADLDLGDGVTADDAKNFVMANTHRYIPKFATLSKKHKLSWNWMAFIFPAGWMLSRKMYKGGIIAAIFSIMSSVMTFPFLGKMQELGYSQTASIYQNYGELAKLMPDIGGVVLALAAAGAVISMAVSIITAMFGDYIYKNHTIDNIKKIKSESQDITADYRKKGGVSFLWFVLGTMIVNYATNILFVILR